jgi:hypothetical protein
MALFGKKKAGVVLTFFGFLFEKPERRGSRTCSALSMVLEPSWCREACPFVQSLFATLTSECAEPKPDRAKVLAMLEDQIRYTNTAQQPNKQKSR